MDALYIPFEVEPRAFKTVMQGLKFLPFSGLNVTIPYKEEIIPFLDALSPEARAIGAVNTVQFGKKLIGHNTDCYGFVTSLKNDLNFSLKEKSVLLLGAGGAARACIYGMAHEGARTICIAEVDQAKAKKLVRHFQKIFPKVQFITIRSQEEDFKIIMNEIDLLVNATPMGLKKEDPLLIPARCFPKKKIAVYDLIYNPKETKLLQVAKKKGCSVSNGAGMLVHQGARAFQIWTGKKAPVEDMRRALLSALKK